MELWCPGGLEARPMSGTAVLCFNEISVKDKPPSKSGLFFVRRGCKSLLMLLISALAALFLQARLVTLHQREMATFSNIVKYKWFFQALT